MQTLIKSKCELISDVVVYGDRQPYLIALVTIDEGVAHRWAEANDQKPHVASECQKCSLLKIHEIFDDRQR